MLRSNYRYSRDHRHFQSTPSPLSNSPAPGSAGHGSPVSLFFDEIDVRPHQHQHQQHQHHQQQQAVQLPQQQPQQGISSLGRLAREGFRRGQTCGGSTGSAFAGTIPSSAGAIDTHGGGGISRSFDLATLAQHQQQHQQLHQQQIQQHVASVTKLVKLLGQEVTTDDKILFDHFFDRGRRNAFANIFCGLSSRGLRRLFAVYGIDEVQTKPPPPPSPASPTPLSPTQTASRRCSRPQSRRRHRRSRESRDGSATSAASGSVSAGGGGGGGRFRAGWQLLGCGQSSSAEEDGPPPPSAGAAAGGGRPVSEVFEPFGSSP